MAKSETRTTTDHGEIRRWAEEREGVPASVEHKASGEDSTFFRLVNR